MKEPLLKWQVFDDAGKMAEVVAGNTLELAEYAISERGRFTIVLAGGSTPVAVYRLLAQTGSG